MFEWVHHAIRVGTFQEEGDQQAMNQGGLFVGGELRCQSALASVGATIDSANNDESWGIT
jgi:hypothetical protein